MANEILDDVLGFSMRKDALELHLQVLCGNISQSTCDIIVYVNSDKRSQLPENERNESLIEKPSHQKGVKYIFHLNMKTGSNSYKWEEMICQCFKEANARECEDVAFDIDRAGEDPSKMATYFEKSMHTLEYSEYPSVSKVYVKGLQIYTANVFYYEMFTNYIVRMTWENRDGNGWYDNTTSMEDFKFECHLDEDWRRLTKYEVLDYLPDDWAEMETKETHKLVTLDNSGYNNKDYIKECFDKDTSNKYRVIEIQRVQIPWLYKMHRMYLDTIEEEDDVSPRKEMLWHGCSPEAAKNISQSGFDMRHVGENGACYYGSGIYFSKSAKRPATLYATPDPRSGLRHVFQCTVVVGEYTLGERALSQPPIRPPRTSAVLKPSSRSRPSPEGKILAPSSSEGTALAPANYRNMLSSGVRPRDPVPGTSGCGTQAPPSRYHSVVDDTDDPSLFVVFKDYAAYPEYMITFREI